MLKLRKSLSALLAVSLLVSAFPMTASAATSISIDGKTVSSSVAPVIENGTTFVPLRFIAENLGATVDWNAGTSTATVTSAAHTLSFTIGSTDYTVDGASETLLAAPMNVSGSTMVPLRAIGEAMGAEVGFENDVVSVDYFSKMTGDVKITGSTTLQPIAQAAADKLIGMNTGLTISVAGGGSGAGVNDTIAGTNNLGMSSRDLTDEEKAQIGDVAVASDGIAVIVHPSNPVQNLTSEQAAQIFLGEIQNWNEVGGPNAPILVQTRETGSGTRATLEEMLLEKEPVVERATPHTSSALIKQAVAAEANAIGFDSIGFVDETVKAVSIDDVEPTDESVKSGNYVMGRQLYILTKGTPSGASAMFIDYLKTADCQENIVVAEGYLTLE